ncbi:MAG: DUF4328 domain-containing protein [Pirellulales bacterium]
MAEEFNAYESPQARDASHDAPMPGQRDAMRPFLPIGGRAKLVVVLLSLSMLLDIVSMFSNSMEIDLIKRMQSDAVAEPNQEDIDANDARQAIVAFTGLGVYLATVIAFCLWIYRAHANLPALGAMQLKYSPGWAVGSFFVPILNLFRPYQIAKEIDLHSDPSSTPASSPLIGLWWAAFLIANFAGQAAGRMTLRANTPFEIISADYVQIGSSATSVLAAILAILVVHRISRNQETLFSLWKTQEDNPTTPAQA